MDPKLLWVEILKDAWILLSVDALTVDDSTLLLTYGEQTVNGLVTVDGADSTLISTTNVNGRNFDDFVASLIVNGTTDTFEGKSNWFWAL